MSVTECCVLGCSSTSNKVSVHSFPKDPARFELWKAAVYSEKISGLTTNELKKRNVCYAHFKEEDYIVGLQRRKLKPNVVPTVNLRKDDTIPLEEINIIETMQPSCSYEVQRGNRINRAHIPVRASTTEVKISGNVQPSWSHNLESDSRARLHTSVCTSEMEVQALGSMHTPRACKSPVQGKTQSMKKRPLSLLTVGTNTGILIPQKARLYKAAKLLLRTQTYSHKKLVTVRKRLRAAKKFYATNYLQSLAARLSPTQQAFIEMQLRSSNFAARGRRFSMKEKILCLSLYKQSRKLYKYLEAIFNLPSGTDLRRLLRSMILQPGLNNNLMNHLQEKARRMRKLEKICCLMWDKVSIKAHIDWSQSLERIMGFEDHGRVRRPKFANVALVFMLRGIKTGWKLPLAFYFSDSQTTSLNLTKLIKEVTGAVVSCGLKIVAYVCDQGSSNVKAITELVSETACQAPMDNQLLGNIIYNNGGPIVAVYDPPHLLKGIRNNLLTKDLEVVNATGDAKEYLSWRIIELVYDIDQVEPMDCLMRKLTDFHIRRHKIKKMRVKHAAQVLSNTVALYIKHQARIRGGGYFDSIRGPLSIPVAEGEAAAKYVQFFNNLFDSCNGHTVRPESTYRVAVSKSSPHVRFWNSATAQLERMQFVDPVTRQRKQRSAVLRNWLSTLQGFQSLNIILHGEGFQYWYPRYINQDPVENFFGSIRALGCRDIKPTALEFVNRFKTLLINNISTRHSAHSNCENKSTGDVLFDLSNLLNSNNFQDSSEPEIF